MLKLKLMERLGGYYYADRIPLPHRVEALSFVFKEILVPKDFLPSEAIKGDVLDLGCGQGAIGEILKSKNPQINLTGVDIRDYSAKNSEAYSRFVKAHAFDFLNKATKEGQQYDLVISVGMPPEEVEKIIEKVNPDKILKPGGWMILVVDSPIFPYKNKKFKIKETKLPIADNIAYYSRPSE